MASASVIRDERAPLLRNLTNYSQNKYSDIQSRLNHKSYSSVHENSWKSQYSNIFRSWGGNSTSKSGRSNNSEYLNGFMIPDDRAYVDQFKSIDWVHDSITDATRARKILCRRDFIGGLLKLFNRFDIWILAAVIGSVVATIAYGITISEAYLFDLKDGFCSNSVFATYKDCCPEDSTCDNWNAWSSIIHIPYFNNISIEFLIFLCLMIIFSILACLLTLTTKIAIPTISRPSGIENNLEPSAQLGLLAESSIDSHISNNLITYKTYYPIAGSGFAETRVILNGFMIRKFLGLRVMLVKSLAVILSISTGLKIGKEGPLVHIAACTGNIVCRFFSKYIGKGEKYRDTLSAAAAAGVVVTFGAPIGGVIFALEEFATIFLPKTTLRTLLCSITATLTLKFLDPYGNGKIGFFETLHFPNWQKFELIPFTIVGILGGATGALFVKFARAWDQFARPQFKGWMLLEVLSVTILTGILSFWDPFTKISSRNLLNNLVSTCSPHSINEYGLCPQDLESYKSVILRLSSALAINGLLMIVAFGIKIPAGIYIPSMVLGGLEGRIFGHLLQMIFLRHSTPQLLMNCKVEESGQYCITPGLYALIAAGSTMCGVTRLYLTVAVILLEITGSLEFIMPISLAILFAKWTADFLEPQSIYDFLTEKNSYPFLNNNHEPVFKSELASILPPVGHENLIDISSSPLVSAQILQMRLDILIRSGGFDGGISIIRDGKLVGILLAWELKIALENLKDKSTCVSLADTFSSYDQIDTGMHHRANDFAPIIQPVYLALDINSPLGLVYQCFVKLGVGYICIMHEGNYAGMIYKRMFAQYTRLISRENRCH